jgi:hypothetical protein
MHLMVFEALRWIFCVEQQAVMVYDTHVTLHIPLSFVI